MIKSGFVALILFLTFSCHLSHAQLSRVDSLKGNHQMLGHTDTLDYFLRSSEGIFPTLGNGQSPFLNPLHVYIPSGSSQHLFEKNHPNAFFSALPYVGFAYGFGTQGSKHLNFQYAQSFRKQWIINAEAKTHGANGFIRNNTWSNRNLHFLVQKSGERYAMQLDVNSFYDLRQFCGGVQVDSLAGLFPLTLLPVRKDSCSSIFRNNAIRFHQDFNFLNRDSLRFFGLLMNTSMSTKNRVFAENDTLSGLYPVIYADSLYTYDRSEWVTSSNELGLRYGQKSLSVSSGITADYWRFRMKTRQMDTLEIGVFAKASYHKGVWDANLEYRKNLSGGFGASFFTFNAAGPIVSGHTWFVIGNVKNEASSVFQRQYFGNTLHFSNSNPSLQHMLLLSMGSRGNWKSLGYLWRVDLLKTSGVFQFDGQGWTNQGAGSVVQLTNMHFEAAWGMKSLRVYPMADVLLQSNASRFLPKWSLGGRIAYTGVLSKAKRLSFFTSLSGQYFAGYKTMGFQPIMATVDFQSIGNEALNYSRMSATLGFQVKTFRFFLSGSNFGSFWMNRTQNVYAHYPIPTWQLKLGVTWDFWN
ncbi:MAG: hypothetical protein EBS09_03325 [Flavobacteriia bacterium]|nr:hypothetical protein [Flavobacteriia bacterium]